MYFPDDSVATEPVTIIPDSAKPTANMTTSVAVKRASEVFSIRNYTSK